jgi:hypothetical protein
MCGRKAERGVQSRGVPQSYFKNRCMPGQSAYPNPTRKPNPNPKFLNPKSRRPAVRYGPRHKPKAKRKCGSGSGVPLAPAHRAGTLRETGAEGSHYKSDSYMADVEAPRLASNPPIAEDDGKPNGSGCCPFAAGSGAAGDRRYTSFTCHVDSG